MLFLVVVCVILLLSTFVVWYELPKSKNNSSGLEQGTTLPKNIGDFALVSKNAVSTEGKVQVLFIGSEACPYCTALSWAVYDALKTEGGQWSHVTYVYSNATDIYPLTPGINFSEAVYSSSEIVLEGYEVTDEHWQTLQVLNVSINNIFLKYDPTKSIPFILIDGLYLHVGKSFSPALLANMTGERVMSDITNEVNLPISDAIQNESTIIQEVIKAV